MPRPAWPTPQHFLDMPSGGTENSEGEVGIYRYRELKSGNAETFVLESLLPGTGYDVHISKMKLIEEIHHIAQAAPDAPHRNPAPTTRRIYQPDLTRCSPALSTADGRSSYAFCRARATRGAAMSVKATRKMEAAM